MTMQRAHLEFIAATIQREFDPNDTYDRAIIAQAFCDALAWTNPRFDPARFLKACGVRDARVRDA